MGDLLRVTLDENPTTGYTTITNALNKKSNSQKSLEPLEEHIVELNSYYARFIDLKARYSSGITGLGGCRVMTFALV